MLSSNLKMISILGRSVRSSFSFRVFKDISRRTCSNIHKCYMQTVIPTANYQPNLQIVRHKSKKTKKGGSQETESSTEPEEYALDDELDKHTKVAQVVVRSMRIDGLLKAGLGIARNKIETLFYESKIRVNGQKLLKKSDSAQIGDEIDIIKGPSPSNPEFLTVARVEVLAISEKGENIAVKVRRSKSLTVENYDKEKPT